MFYPPSLLSFFSSLTLQPLLSFPEAPSILQSYHVLLDFTVYPSPHPFLSSLNTWLESQIRLLGVRPKKWSSLLRKADKFLFQSGGRSSSSEAGLVWFRFAKQRLSWTEAVCPKLAKFSQSEPTLLQKEIFRHLIRYKSGVHCGEANKSHTRRARTSRNPNGETEQGSVNYSVHLHGHWCSVLHDWHHYIHALLVYYGKMSIARSVIRAHCAFQWRPLTDS